jgi:hypothetical protein
MMFFELTVARRPSEYYKDLFAPVRTSRVDTSLGQ